MPEDARNRDVPTWCFVLPWSLTKVEGGVNQVVKNLIREFEVDARDQWQPLVLETHWSAPHTESILPSGTEVLQASMRSPFENRASIRGALSFLAHLPSDLLRLRRLAKRYNITVFNVHYVDGVALNFVLLKEWGLFRGQVILSLHGSDIRTAQQTRGLARWLWKRMLRGADAVVACSDGLGEEARMLEPRAKMVTVHNGMDVNRFAAASRADFEWPPELADHKIVIHVGAFQRRKGHDLLVKAFRIAKTEHPESALVLVGGGAELPAIRALTDELGLTDSARFFENVPHEQIFDLLAHSDVFVFPSRWEKGIAGEGFAIALLEAGAAGVPVVATEACGVAEIIEDGITGRLVPLEDVEALAGAICEMLENPDRAQQMARNLRRTVTEHFTWKRAVESYIALGGGLDYSGRK